MFGLIKNNKMALGLGLLAGGAAAAGAFYNPVVLATVTNFAVYGVTPFAFLATLTPMMALAAVGGLAFVATSLLTGALKFLATAGTSAEKGAELTASPRVHAVPHPIRVGMEGHSPRSEHHHGKTRFFSPVEEGDVRVDARVHVATPTK